MARRRFFVNEVRGGKAQLTGDDAHHLTRVLRVEAGQKYEISDNESAYLAEVEAARKELVTFVVLERLPVVERLLKTTLYASLIRFERFELLLEKATELGVERIVPVRAARSEKGLERAALKRTPRWQRIVREAAEQSRRMRLPILEEPSGIDIVLAAVETHRFLLDEDPAATPILQAVPARDSQAESVALLVGPEGGWGDRERAGIVGRGWRPVSLGPYILKAETAVLAALAILNAAWQTSRHFG